MHPLPEALVECLKNRQAVLVTGLGCSGLVGFPGWLALCERLAEHIENKLEQQAVLDFMSTKHLCAAMSLIRDSLSEKVLVEVLTDAFPAKTQAPESLQHLANACWRGIITTSPDGLWASALTDDPEIAGRMVFADTIPTLEVGRGRFLIQLFGHADTPASLCLAPFEIPTKIIETGASRYLQNLHQKWSFVFIGFTPNDPDLVMLAGRLLGASPSTLEHFYIGPDLSPIDARRVRVELGLVPVSIDGNLENMFKVLAEASNLAKDKPPVDDVEAWLERLTADPENEEAQDMLEQGLAKLCEEKQWERLVSTLIHRVELITDPKEQAADLYEAGMVLDKELKAPDRAFPVLMMALRLTPQNGNLLTETKSMAEAAGQTKELLEELRTLEKESADSPEGGQMSLSVARMLAEDPQRGEEAIAAFKKILDREPANPEALDGLEAVFRKAERWNDLRAILEKAIEIDPASIRASAKLEELYERTEQTPQLIELLQARLARNPDDVTASDKLEKLYEQAQRWQPLGALYERLLVKNPTHADLQAKLEALYQKTQQWQPLGVLFERQLADNPDNPEILGKVEDLYRRSEQWRPLADLLERRAEKQEPADARALRLERAVLFIDKVKDFDGALAIARAHFSSDPTLSEEIFSKCLDRDPGNPASLLAMAELARSKGDHLRAVKFMLDASERTQNPLELGRLFADAGTIELDHLGAEAKAIEFFERSLAADPEQSSAALRLLGLREKHEDFAGAEPLLELMLRKTEDSNKAVKADLYQRLAHATRKLGKFDKASNALASAAKFDSESPSLAHELADLHFERKNWTEARAEYRRALALFGDAAPPAEIASLLENLAACSVKLDELDTALQQYEEALALDPEKRSILETLIDLYTVRGDWKELLVFKRRLLPLVHVDEDKAKILEEVGDILREKQNDWVGAMEAYLEALAFQAERRQVLYKTLEYYTQEKQWPSAVETLQKLAGLESDAPARVKLNYAVAAICRDEMKNTQKAVELFSKVLDDNPTYPKAFEAIEKLLGEAKEYKNLERAYRDQLKRLPEDGPVEVKLRLWDGLADASLKQHDKESAAVTMELALSFDRENIARQERLAKLYFEMGPTAADKAIAQHQLLISKKPDRIDSYKALAALFFQAGAHDKMWCVAGAMTCLGKADPPLQALYENFRPSQMPNTTGRLNGELWRKLVHPSENPYLGALFTLLSPAIAMTTAQTAKAVGLDRNSRVDLTGNNWSYAAALRYVGNSIEATLPDVFIKRDIPGTVNLVNLKEKSTLAPALVIGIGFDQLSSQSQVIFDLAKRMVMLRPERFPRFALGTVAALDIAVRAGLQLGGSPIGHGDHGDEVNRMVKQIDNYLATPLRAELKILAKKYVEACGDKVDVISWIAASDLTASRAALILCGDIVAASRVLMLESSGQSPLPIQERVSDLIAYFVSEDHFAVRAALGMQVNLTPPNEPLGTQPKRHMSHMQIKTG